MPTRTVNKQEVEISWEGNYAAGHPLSAAEAHALNQLVFSMVGKNAKNAEDSALAKNPPETFDLAAYMNENLPIYEFGRTRTVDPVEREAKKLIRAALDEKLRELGRTATEKAKTENVTKIMEGPKREDWMKKARKSLEAARKSASEFGDDLNFDE